MKSSEPSRPLEDQKSPDLRLFEFLQRSNAQKEYPTFHRMFNTPFKMSDIVAQHKEFLQDGYEVFRQITADGRVVYNDVAYVHIKDLCQDDKLRYHLSRRFDVFPGCFKGICTVHKRACRILEENFAFSLYLHYVELGVSQESAQEQYLEDYDEMEEELAIEHSEESQDEEQFIDLEEERTEIAALDLISLKVETLRDAVPINKIEVDSSNYAVPMLPSFKLCSSHANARAEYPLLSSTHKEG